MKISVTTPTKDEFDKMDFSSWGTWECGVSTFPWSYDATETCYILDGHAKVETSDQKVEFKKGDMVVFPNGLACTWTVIKPIKKYYKFD
jgi:uncharacterized protein